MALCGGVGAMALPSELIVHIFSFLSDRDKLRASSVCSRWRECLFYPALWTHLKLKIGGGGGGLAGSGETRSELERLERLERLEFLIRKFGSFVRELQLELAPVEDYLSPLQGGGVEGRMEGGVDGRMEAPTEAVATYLDQVLCLLSSIRNNRNMQKLSLYGDPCLLQDEGIMDSSCLTQALSQSQNQVQNHVLNQGQNQILYQGQNQTLYQAAKRIKEIQQLFMEVLSNSRQMKWLSSAFMLGVLTPSSLASLSNASAASLEHLSLLDGLATPLAPPSELARLPNLRSLGLDFCHFTSDMCRLLASPDRPPLHRLSLLLNGAALEAGSLDSAASEEEWKGLRRRSGNLRVYLMGMEVSSQVLLRVLKPSLPLERLHLDSYNTLVSDAALELIAQQYNKTLSHFLLMRDDAGFPDLSINRNEDPLVLLAWRCTQLAVLVVHGYIVWSHNLVAISRLRGSSLRVLSVSEESIDFDPDQSVYMEGDPVHNLVKEVSLGLGRAWHPSLDSSLVLSEPTQHFHRQLQAFSAGI